MKILFFGISLKVLMAEGSKIKPEEMMRNDATWKAVRLTRPSFIKIKLLPQIKDSTIKRNQLKNLLFKVFDVIFKLVKKLY